MPKIRRRGVPRAVLDHLRTRLLEREINAAQLDLFSHWLDAEPEVPAGRWFKSLPGLIVCGEGELVKTFLRPGQVPSGKEIR